MFTVTSDYNKDNTKRPRIGQLFDDARAVTTPHFSVGTQRGSVPNLTPDMVETLPALKTLQISVGEVNALLPALKAYGDALKLQKPYHKMTCMRDDQTIIVALRNPLTDLIYTKGRYLATPEQEHVESQFPYQISSKLVASRSESGAVKMTPQEFMAKAKELSPDMLLLVGEDSNIADSNSRAEKTQRRNLEFIDVCLKEYAELYNLTAEDTTRPFVVVPLEGATFLDKRQRYGGYMSRKGNKLWVEHIEPKKEDFATEDEYKAEHKKYRDKLVNEGVGVPIQPDGFHLGGLGSTSDSAQRVAMINASLQYIENNDKELLSRPFSRFRMTTVPGEPAELADILYNGVDFVSSTYPSLLTDEGLAMNIPITLQALKNAKASQDFAELTEQDKLHRYNIMNLRDEIYTEDNQPLNPDCGCYTCHTHSRAYINHLLNTQEMLAEVLLTLHNTHQYGLFFDHFKQLVALDQAYQNDKAEPKKDDPESPLNQWYALAKEVYVPHVNLLHRNVRRRYAHQNAANNPTTTDMNDDEVL